MSDDLPPNNLPSDQFPYGVDTIRLRITWPAAPASRGYNGRMWRMRPLRGWSGGARQDAPAADAVTTDRDGLAAAGPGHAPAFPEQGQAVPANQAIEGGGPASELLAAFRALRAGAPQGRGPTAKEADAGLASAPEQQSLVEGAGFSNIPIRNGTGTASDAFAPDTASRDGNVPGSAPPIAVAASLPLGGRSTNAPASGDAGSATVRLGTVTTALPPSGVAVAQAADGAANTQALSNGQRIQQAISYFQSQGWSRQQAIGIVANLDAESGMDPNVPQRGGGPGYGLAQWEKPRQRAFQAWAGHDIHNSTFEEQLQFVQYELTHSQATAGNALHQATTAADAASIVTRLYEGPRDKVSEAIRRAERARRIENQVGR